MNIYYITPSNKKIVFIFQECLKLNNETFHAFTICHFQTHLCWRCIVAAWSYRTWTQTPGIFGQYGSDLFQFFLTDKKLFLTFTILLSSCQKTHTDDDIISYMVLLYVICRIKLNSRCRHLTTSEKVFHYTEFCLSYHHYTIIDQLTKQSESMICIGRFKLIFFNIFRQGDAFKIHVYKDNRKPPLLHDGSCR